MRRTLSQLTTDHLNQRRQATILDANHRPVIAGRLHATYPVAGRVTVTLDLDCTDGGTYRATLYPLPGDTAVEIGASA